MSAQFDKREPEGARGIERPKPRIRFYPECNRWILADDRLLSHYMWHECVDCGFPRVISRRGMRCAACAQKKRERFAYVSGTASYKVKKAVEKGLLPRLDGSIPCADCGKPAQEYDHRSYAKPLEVEPVCRKCNKKRGPAIEFQLTEAVL